MNIGEKIKQLRTEKNLTQPQLAEAIVALLNDTVLCARYGAAGRQRVLEQFSLEQCVTKYNGLYTALQRGGSLVDCPDLRVAVEIAA